MWKSLRRNWESDELDKGNQPISKELHDSLSLKVELMEKNYKSVDGSTVYSKICCAPGQVKEKKLCS
jgi:hypothetical protein